MLNLALCGSSVLLFSRSASLLTLTLEAVLRLLAPFEWQFAYVPVLPDARSLEYLNSPVPFLMGCLQGLQVSPHARPSLPDLARSRPISPDLARSRPISLQVSPRELISAQHVHAKCPSCFCYDLDQREEAPAAPTPTPSPRPPPPAATFTTPATTWKQVGELDRAGADEFLAMPASMTRAIEASLTDFEATVLDIQAQMEGLQPDEELPPALDQAATFDRPISFRPPKGPAAEVLELRATRPPAAAIAAGVTRREHKPVGAAQAVVPPVPDKLATLSAEDAARRQASARAAVLAHLDAATRWQEAEAKLLAEVREQVSTLCPPEDLTDAHLDAKKESARKTIREEVRGVHAGFAKALVAAQHFDALVTKREEQREALGLELV